MNIKKKYQNISRNYFDIIRKKNYSPSYGGHPKNKSFFCESHKNNIYKRKVCPIDQKRNSISQNNSKNNIKKENNFEDTNSRKRNPINNLKDSYYLNTLDNYNFGRILPEQKSLGKENDYSNSSRINFNPNLNIINEDEGNDYIKFNHSPKFKNNYQLIIANFKIFLCRKLKAHSLYDHNFLIALNFKIILNICSKWIN